MEDNSPCKALTSELYLRALLIYIICSALVKLHLRLAYAPMLVLDFKGFNLTAQVNNTYLFSFLLIVPSWTSTFNMLVEAFRL